jgi:Flp pilus assembly pilin Flp
MTGRHFVAPVRLVRDESGAYMLEFALIMPVFLLLVMGIFDLGTQMYAKAALGGAVEYAARNNTLEGNAANQSAIDQMVRDRVGVAARYATLSFNRTNFDNYVDVNKAEQFTDTNGNGSRDAGECYTDANSSNSYSSSRGASGQGGASDVVLYRVDMSFNRIFPLWAFLGQPQAKTISVSTVLRNQPYTSQTTSSVVLCS